MTSKIKVLPIHLVNQIAAGEVIERPASIIKELVENSVDAGSTAITVKIQNGGKTFISILDNGSGIDKDDLVLCLKPHATSKLNKDNFNYITTLGFRGEALASIASVSRITIASKEATSEIGYEISANAGNISDVSKSNVPQGTLIQVSDLFYSIPARLGFLRTDGVETTYCYKIFKQLALASPNVSFKLENNDKVVFNYIVKGNTKVEQLRNRAEQILGSTFAENSLFIDEKNPMLKLYGFVGIPTYSKNNQDEQYLILNGRPLKDKTISGIIKFAYSEVLFSGKHPAYALFIDINPSSVDVNVSPTKSEVRFKDVGFIRHLILSSIKTALGLSSTQKTNSTLGSQLFNRNNYSNKNLDLNIFQPQKPTGSLQVKESESSYLPEVKPIINEAQEDTKEPQQETPSDFPLGFAKAQFHKNWIVAQNKDGLILVDQHAAHERITQEIIKEQYFSKNIPQQLLLHGELLKLDPLQMEVVDIYQEQIRSLGISFDIFGKDSIVIKGLPSILKNPNPVDLMLDIIADFKELETPQSFNKKLNDIISTIACHSSIRSGRIMNVAEMDDLLRTMEKTPNYAQCSHGRPTYIHISLADIEKLFSRS
ncbi:MAG: DNA mismatch repair endonuclease MutL [Alphaproteobacteria bacterium]|jgi:DNA mismatch repair protein MutL|nr:DNA mismatch repair endonuclease MutL [Alphaproteobacteria bacterium]